MKPAEAKIDGSRTFALLSERYQKPGSESEDQEKRLGGYARQSLSGCEEALEDNMALARFQADHPASRDEGTPCHEKEKAVHKLRSCANASLTDYRLWSMKDRVMS